MEENKQSPGADSERKGKGAERSKFEHNFEHNNKYFTICIYAFVLVIVSALVIKMIMSLEQTLGALKGFLHTLSPFLIGILIAYVLNPFIQWVLRFLEERCKIKNNVIRMVLSIAFVYVVVLGFVGVALVYILPEIIDSISDLVVMIPKAYDETIKWIDSLQERYPNIDMEIITTSLKNTLPELFDGFKDVASNMIPTLYSVSMSIVQWVINILIALIVSIYMLYDKKNLMRAMRTLMYAFLPKKSVPIIREVLTECNHLFNSFIVGKFIDSTIIGILCFLLMSLFRFPYVLLISMIVGVTNMIPYFGPFIGAVPGALIILLINPLQAVGYLIMILALQQFDGLILGPKILGDSTGLKPLWIIFAITLGGSIAGVIGMFLGVPVVAVISYLIERLLSYRLKKRGITEEIIEDDFLIPKPEHQESIAKRTLNLNISIEKLKEKDFKEWIPKTLRDRKRGKRF